MKAKSIAIIITAVLGLLIIIFVLIPHKKTPLSQSVLPTPTPISSSSNYLNTLIPTVQAQAAVPLTQEGERKLENLSSSKQPLSSTEASAKQQILQHLDTNTGAVYSQPTFRVDYIAGIDEFQVEIETTNIQQDKQDALTWFSSQGIQGSSVCKLPLMFYLNYDVAQKLRGQGLQFNPIPDNC